MRKDGPGRTTDRRARRRFVAAGLAVGLVSTAIAGASMAQAAKKPRPDLVVLKGSASVTKGRLVVGFTIKNAGNARAASSKAAVATVVGGKVVALAKVSVAPVRVGRSVSGITRVGVPKALGSGAHQLSLCADRDRTVTEGSETNNCLDLGTLSDGKVTKPSTASTPIPKPADVPTAAPSPGSPAPAPAPGAPPAPVGTGTPVPTPTSSVPTAPVPRRTGEVYKLGNSWVYVPTTYDATNNTPIRLLVWMHGCGGVSEYELWNATVGENQDYLGMAPSGADGGCWDVNASPATVLAQIAELQTHFNIDRRRIVLGGYSSGGDMSYRMGIDYPARFAGLLVENASPYRDSGVTNAAATAATPKLQVVHLAHLQDATYAIAGVRNETNQMIAAGFPLKRIERVGTHYDEPGANVNGQVVSGTDPDVKTYLLPNMTENWQSPGG